MIKTGYSFRTAYGHLEDVAERLKDIGWTHGPMADRCSTFGYNRWTKICKAKGLKPVYGVEIAVTPALGEKKPRVDYFTFLCIDNLRDIHNIIFSATKNVGREPSLTYRQALCAPGVIVIAGERLQLSEIPPEASLHLALSPATPRGLYRAAKERGFSFVALSSNAYPTEDLRDTYRVTLGKYSNTQSYPQHILSDEEWHQALKWADEKDRLEALANRQKILEQCNAQLNKAEFFEFSSNKSLKELCLNGAARLGINCDVSPYAERLEKELKVIQEKGFDDYFHIIADLMVWAREKMVVGPARGSSCGSLVCYLLGITAIDPVAYNLLFERFLDVTRTDLPDIDLDFSDTRRHLIFDYVEKKYGREYVARLGTINFFQPRSALNQIGAGLKIPRFMIEKTAEQLISYAAGDERAHKQLEDTLRTTPAGEDLVEQFPEVLQCTNIENHPNVSSQHAAGLVITKKSITDYVAFDWRTKSIMCDKKDAEDLNLLKIDALGLTQLSIFERTLELIGKPALSSTLEALPRDDAKAFEVLNKGQYAGIFQFQGQALQALTNQVKVEKLDDIVAITALARPGPLDSGGAAAWVRRKNKHEEISFPHPDLERILKNTLGVIVYQEQVMQIVRELAGFSWEDVSSFRRAIGKSQGQGALDKYSEKWREGTKHIPFHISEAIWSNLVTFGAYGFNLSHAVAYGLLSYWCCWLKAYHPVEFAAASLDAESDPDKQIALLKELQSEGIDYVAVDPESSRDQWMPVKRANQLILVGPLTNIKGLGPSFVREVLEARDKDKELRPALSKRLKEAKTAIDSLYPVSDQIKKLHPNLEAINIVSEPVPVKEVQPGKRGEVMILAVAKRITLIDENEPDRLAKRGRAFTGPTKAVNLWFKDDTDEIFCKIDRFTFARLGQKVIEQGRAGKSLFAVKGFVPHNFRMIKITAIKYLGDMEDHGRGSTEDLSRSS